MYFQAIAVLVTAASAAALPSRLVAREGGDFDVSNFKAYRQGNTPYTIVDFDLDIPASGLAETHCTANQTTDASLDTPTQENMGPVSAICDEREQFFSFDKDGAGDVWELKLSFANTDGRLTKGTHMFTKTDDVSGGSADNPGPSVELLSLSSTSFTVTGVTDTM